MDDEVLRLTSLLGPGDDGHLLGALARANPTLLQLRLLTTVPAVRDFVAGCTPGLGIELDHSTRARLAVLDPSLSQLALLTTSEAVQQFVQLRMPSAGEGRVVISPEEPQSNPVGTLFLHCSPNAPVFMVLPEELPNYRIQCVVGELSTSGVGRSKRIAKALAAAEMLRLLCPEAA